MINNDPYFTAGDILRAVNENYLLLNYLSGEQWLLLYRRVEGSLKPPRRVVVRFEYPVTCKITYKTN